MATEGTTGSRVDSGSGAARITDPDERSKHARHEIRGSLGILQGALQTALDKDRPLSLEQRIELVSLAREAMPQLAAALDDYIALLENPTDIRLPE